MSDVIRDLEDETVLAAQLLAQWVIEIVEGDDDADELVENTIEGETNFIEALQKAADYADVLSSQVAGAKARQEHWRLQAQRAQQKFDRVKDSIQMALVASGMPKQKATLGDGRKLAVMAGRKRVNITGEDLLPRRYVETIVSVVPNKNKIMSALKDNKEVPGAELILGKDYLKGLG